MPYLPQIGKSVPHLLQNGTPMPHLPKENPRFITIGVDMHRLPVWGKCGINIPV